MDNQIKKKSLMDFFAENRVIHIIFSIIIGLVVVAFFLFIMGYDFIEVYSKIISIVFSSSKSITYTIVFSVPYIIIGIAIVFSFKAGIFNIGAEGQFVIGGITSACVGIIFKDLPSIILVPLCIFSAMIAGAIFASIIAICKIKYGVNEIVIMIMFNWIAFYISNFIAETPFIKSTTGNTATKNISDNALIMFDKQFNKSLNLCPIMGYGIFIAIFIAIIVYYLINKTTFGYKIRAVGLNSNAAEYAGINVKKVIIEIFAISGSLSALAGALQLMGMSKRISVFSIQEGFGFAGIVTALIACFNPIGCIFSGFFYAILKYGGRALNLISAPSEVIDIIIGTIIFFIAISNIFKYIKYLKKHT